MKISLVQQTKAAQVSTACGVASLAVAVQGSDSIEGILSCQGRGTRADPDPGPRQTSHPLCCGWKAWVYGSPPGVDGRVFRDVYL